MAGRLHGIKSFHKASVCSDYYAADGQTKLHVFFVEDYRVTIGWLLKHNPDLIGVAGMVLKLDELWRGQHILPKGPTKGIRFYPARLRFNKLLDFVRQQFAAFSLI